MIKSYKVRLYPNKEQEAKIWKHIGCCRFMWNYMLDVQNKAYENGEKHLSAFDMINLITPLKKDENYAWLSEVSRNSLNNVCQDLDKAFKAFFKKISGYPDFKSRRKAKPNYPLWCNSIHFCDNKVNVEKVGKVKYKSDRKIPQGKEAKFENPRISFLNGKWFLSFAFECENQTPELTDKLVGIDLGIKESAVVAYGDEQIVFHNINKGKQIRDIKRKMRHIQRSISRKYEANKQGNTFVKTNNIAKLEAKLRYLYARLTGIRDNYIHQSTHKIVSMLPKRVVMEDLNVTGMMKNKHLSKAIAEQKLNEWIRQMKYKCEWNGVEFVQADRFYPSSKTCSNCGYIHKKLKLNDRTFACPSCGFTIDRDYQAALNLQRYAV